MKKLTEKTREKLLRGALIASVLLFLTGAVLLWENRRGTPGEPADFYYALLRDGVELNRPVMADTGAKGYPRYLVVDLSGSILTAEEKAEVLGRLGERYRDLTVLDLPMGEDRGSYSMQELMADVSAATGTPVDDLMHNAGLFPLSFTVEGPLPPREEFGVQPIRVDYLMWWGGWRGRSDIDYLHYPLVGWQGFGSGTEYQIS